MDAIWLGKYCALFLGEIPNPIPICLGTMTHEQEEKGNKVFWETLKEAIRTELF